MKEISQVLLKRGINGLLHEDEEYFKHNVIDTITFKLNESLKEAKQEVQQKLLLSKSVTETNSNIQEFVNFVKNFENGKYTFKNGMNINISNKDIKNLINLFESLNPENRKKMAEKIFDTPEIFKEHLKFSEQAKGIIWKTKLETC